MARAPLKGVPVSPQPGTILDDFLHSSLRPKQADSGWTLLCARPLISCFLNVLYNLNHLRLMLNIQIPGPVPDLLNLNLQGRILELILTSSPGDSFDEGSCGTADSHTLS